MNTIKYMYNKTSALLCALCLLGALCVTSCEDMLDKGNEYVIYADNHMIGNAADTVTSVVGILNKLQSIAVRNNLFGELRADLVEVRSNATTDLKSIAELTVDDDNAYNVPRDFYSIINNCNYFLAHADSLAGNTNRGIYYFATEIAQVHSIRAWTYLQMVLLYGRVPFVTEPVVTKLQSDAKYPLYDLEQICDYFIQDLKPYYGRAYPDYGTFDTNIDPQLCFFPTQIVTGDLYLWLAAKRQDPEMAKQAAKAYYDYIVWNQSGKRPLTTGDNRVQWSTQTLTNGTYHSPNGSLSYGFGSAWGTAYQPAITAIPMDSAAADGHYNELRLLYNTRNTDDGDYQEASIQPSKQLYDLSVAQEYVDQDGLGFTVKVTADKFTEEQINRGYLGDLRYQDTYYQRTFNLNSQDVDLQTIYKHSYQHIGVYRAPQIYLRLAEALNYAGYPRFARQILTMGLSNLVIENEVQPYYTTAQDSAFIQYFDFNTTEFIPYVQAYDLTTAPSGVVISRTPNVRANTETCNMVGIHARGSGLPFYNANYAPLAIPDSTGYPYDKEAAIGVRPTKSDYTYPVAPRVVKIPSTWDLYPNEVVSKEVYATINPGLTATALDRAYGLYVDRDSVGAYNTYLTETVPAYEAEVAAVDAIYQADYDAYAARLNDFLADYDSWYRAAYASPSVVRTEQDMVDKLILDEQALELAYEGNRFYDLMRRALWYNDNSRLATPIGQRDATVGAKLLNRDNWYIQWKGEIGPNAR